jgi:hypothetical protein
MCYEFEWFEWQRAAEQQRRKQQADESNKDRPAATPAKPTQPEPKIKDTEPLPV